MYLLVGLGNPGEKYARHRHNIGFMAADAIAARYGFGPAKSKFQGELREGEIGGVKTLILKPQTFMNDSGRSVGEAARFYKIAPEHVIVFYDELDLAPGKLRVKTGGGAAGHNGIRSIDAHLGSNYRRVRIGIGHPGDKARVTGHVLGDFSKADQDWLAPMLDAIAEAAPFLADANENRFATAVAQKLAPARPEKPVKPEATPEAPAATEKPKAKGPFDALKRLIDGEEKP
ncbi:MAG: aminoacyl-tRNA hydrolase [Parvularculaceae bacterium]